MIKFLGSRGAGCAAISCLSVFLLCVMAAPSRADFPGWAAPPERGFVLVRDDYVTPTITQDLPWPDAAASGCLYGLAHDDWYGTGVDQVRLAATDAGQRWLNEKETWQEQESWWAPQYLLPLAKFMDQANSPSPLSTIISKRLPQGFITAEHAQLEHLSCRLSADCQPLIWLHCFNDPTLLRNSFVKVHGKVTDRNGNGSQMTAADPVIEADFVASPETGPAPLKVQFKDQSRGAVTTLEWDFGDGATSCRARPLHTYQKPGTYTVTLSVSGPTGWHTTSREIQARE